MTTELSCRQLVRQMTAFGADQKQVKATLEDAAAEIERLRDLVRRALPMATALDATKTAVVWTVDLQVDATMLVRDMRAALKA